MYKQSQKGPINMMLGKELEKRSGVFHIV